MIHPTISAYNQIHAVERLMVHIIASSHSLP
jgi:hypothetical protein